MRGILSVAVVLGGVVLLGVLLVNFVIMPSLVRHDASARVPEVVGLDVAAARRACDAAGLQLVEEGKRHGDGVLPGHVLSQTPASGSAVDTPTRRATLDSAALSRGKHGPP